MKKNILKTVDGYLARLPKEDRRALENVRKTIRKTAPEAEELLSYGMPAFKYHNRILAYYAAFKDHLSLFTAPQILNDYKKKLKAYKLSKGTIRFTVEKPLPAGIVRQIIKAKMQDNLKRDR